MFNIFFTKLNTKNINCLIVFLALLVCVLTFLCVSCIYKTKKNKICKKNDVLDDDVFTFDAVYIDDDNYKDSKNLAKFSYNGSEKLHCPFMQDLYKSNKFL